MSQRFAATALAVRQFATALKAEAHPLSGGKAGKFHEILKAGLKLHCHYTVITLHL